MKTYSAKPNEVVHKWYLVDAENIILGRLASIVAKILRGKHKTMYTPHIDCGDNIIVVNAEKVKLSGQKRTDKTYYWHTGYPGGIKDTTPYELKGKNKSQEVLRYAVKRMLPGGPLAKKQLTKLKIYSGSNHPHEAQNPEFVDLKKLNKKNIIKN